MVGDSGSARVHVGAAELLGRHVLAGRRLHERRAADEDRPRALDDHRLVAHRRHVCAAGGARAHHHGDLRDPFSGHARLVVEDAAEVLAVGEDLGLQRQKGAAGVDEVDARQPVLLRHLLRAQVLFHRQREVGAALHRRVVGDDDALLPLDDADAGDDPGRGRARRTVPRGERVQLEQRGARVDQPVDPLAGGQLAARTVPLDRLLAAAAGDERRPLAQLRDQRLHPLGAARERLVALELGGEQRHETQPNERLQPVPITASCGGTLSAFAPRLRRGCDRPARADPLRQPRAGDVLEHDTLLQRRARGAAGDGRRRRPLLWRLAPGETHAPSSSAPRSR